MKTEIECACEFFSRMLQTRNLPNQFIKPFRRRLEELLLARFQDHWDSENPHRGSAYRCIRINGSRLDPLVREAAKVTGLTDIGRYLPAEFTMWIDPKDVSYRFGEEGSICQCSLDYLGVNAEWDHTSTSTTGTSNSYSYVGTVYRTLSSHRLDYSIPVHA